MRKPSSPMFFLSILLAFGAGGLCNASMGKAWASPDYRGLDVFARVLAHVENSYVDEVKSTTLIYGAIKGMLGVLDPYSIFLAPEELAAMRDDSAGEFGGLGIEMSEAEEGLLVVSPLDDTPASRAGIRAGDQILAIGGESTKGMTILSAVKRMRGAPGSKVKLLLMREGFAEPRELTLRRDVVRLESVVSSLYPDGFGYVRIKHFQEKTDEALGKALLRLRKENGGKELAGLVLDLRNNPGGLLEQAVLVADRFLSKGVIVTTEGRGGRPMEIHRAHEVGTEPNYPLIVLVNEGSASASEIVAGALQDYGRAVLMGTGTFGKGSVQSVIDLEDGSGLKLTIARYYTPKHRSFQGHGIVPDVLVPAQAAIGLEAKGAQKEEKASLSPLLHGTTGDALAMPAAIMPPGISPASDHQLRTAVEALQAWHSSPLHKMN